MTVSNNGSWQALFEQAITLHQAGSLSAAADLYERVLAQVPQHADANHNLGLIRLNEEKPAAALPYMQAALTAAPGHEPFWRATIQTLLLAGQPAAARNLLSLARKAGMLKSEFLKLDASGTNDLSPDLRAAKQRGSRSIPDRLPQTRQRLHALFDRNDNQAFERAIARFIRYMPNDPWALNMRGALRQREGNLEEARRCYLAALHADPDYPESCYNLSLLLFHRGEYTAAEPFARRVVELHPEFAGGHALHGECLLQQGAVKASESAYRNALALDPALITAHNNLAILLRNQSLPDEAEEHLRQAIALKPDYADAWCNLGSVQLDLSRIPDAVNSYRRSLSFNPHLVAAHDSLLFALTHDESVGMEEIFREHLEYAEHFEKPLKQSWIPHQNSPEPDRRVRIGFVSADLREHSMAHFIEPIFEHLRHDPAFSLHVYSNHPVEDSVTHKLSGLVANWRRVHSLSEDALAEKIREDAIDILIDLSGHTSDNRLMTFARKPAPVQAGWIGYLGTSGMSSMDYYLADEFFLPPGRFDRYFTEKLIHLPVIAAFEPSSVAPAVSPLPALSTGHFTFASFARLTKLNRSVIALWAEILRALPQARLLLANMPRDGHTEELASWFRAEGIAADRLDFQQRQALPGYFELLAASDLCLDPFPYTGATTTSHAAWAGVPTLTLEGDMISGRLGPAFLRHLGLGEFVVPSRAEYLEKAIFWANHLPRLAEIRSTLRDSFLASPLGQPATFAEGFGRALREMWQQWCASREPEVE